MHPDTTEVITRFNDAFQQHDPASLVAKDCVLESASPAPDGARYEGHDACVELWQQVATDPAISFDLEDTIVLGDRAIVLWRLWFGATDEEPVRGVNLMRVRDGKTVEALDCVKGS